MYKAYWGNTKDLKSLQKEFSDRQKSNINNTISSAAQRRAFLANQEHQRLVQQENERINQLNVQTHMMNMDNFAQQNMINNMMIQQQTMQMQMHHFM